MKMLAPKGHSFLRHLNPQARREILVNGSVPGLDLYPGSLLFVLHLGPVAQEHGFCLGFSFQ